jgi:hypothetical protein
MAIGHSERDNYRTLPKKHLYEGKVTLIVGSVLSGSSSDCVLHLGMCDKPLVGMGHTAVRQFQKLIIISVNVRDA